MSRPSPPPPPELRRVPLWLSDYFMEERDRETERLRGAEKIILSLRRKLRATDPSLPNEYDGTAWAEIEKVEDV